MRLLLMKQTASFISTYSADVFGVCSALYELGGMTVMHDASGCNSTYNTHDEPRWYDMDSMVYISALTETEAIMGDDEKLISDIVGAAKELSPKFIAVAGSPIPMMTGTDFEAVALVIEKRTGIPAFGFSTNGMHSYLRGVGMAFEALAKRMVAKEAEKTKELSANIIGLTPLDFSLNGSAESIKKLLTECGINIISAWAMGSSLSEIEKAGTASVNLVVSSSGISAAKELEKMFGTPYVVGIPYGKSLSEKLISDLKTAAQTGKSVVSYAGRAGSGTPEIAVIGESAAAGSLAFAVGSETGKAARVLCPLETAPELLLPLDCLTPEEDDLALQLKNFGAVIADPLYRPICPEGCRFIALPHEAFSGRIYREEIPDLISDFDKFFKLAGGF